MEEYTLPTYDESDSQINAKIKVIGVGGGGSNAIEHMVAQPEDQVEYWVFNTDSQNLSISHCKNKLMLGKNVTAGLGAGNDPAVGEKAALDTEQSIQRIVSNSNMVFVVCGEGGGTGTGAAPVVAKLAKESGALVIGLVTRPFEYEGPKRKNNALEGTKKLQEYADSVMIVSNDKMNYNCKGVTFGQAYQMVNEVFRKVVHSVTEMILKPGTMNVDFADVRRTLTDTGLCMIGVGEESGPDMIRKATNEALNPRFLEVGVLGAKRLIVNATISSDCPNELFDTIEECIGKKVGRRVGEYDVIHGFQFFEDPNIKNTVRVTVVATDFDRDNLTKEVVDDEPIVSPDETVSEKVDEPEVSQDDSFQNNDASDSIFPRFFEEHRKSIDVEEKKEEEVKTEPVIQERNEPIKTNTYSYDDDDDEPSIIFPTGK